MDHRTRNVATVAALLFALIALGCATFKPRPMEEILFMERAQTQEREGLRITVAVLDRDETRRAFGVDLSKKQIQPVWLEIENETEVPYVLMLTGLDPAYFSAREAAYKSHFRLRPITNGKIDDHFDDFGIDPFVPPLESTSGFVFSNLKLGTKEVRVKLYGPRRVHIFEFYVPTPTSTRPAATFARTSRSPSRSSAGASWRAWAWPRPRSRTAI